jgi:glutathione synthase/RimK-type ligase-like ATP-grasp enzyme
VLDAGRLPADGPAADVVLARADLRSPADLDAFADIVRRAESRGAACFPSAAALVLAEDKRRTQTVLERAAPPAVPTLVVRPTPEGLPVPADRAFRFPVALKEPVGWGGRGLVVCRDADELRRAAAACHARDPHVTLLLQPFVPHRRGLTVRVAAGRAVGLFATTARSTSAPGATRYADADTDPTTESRAVRAVAACGLVFGTADFADADDGSRPVLEVNSMPGLDPDESGDRAFAEAIVRAVTGRP